MPCILLVAIMLYEMYFYDIWCMPVNFFVIVLFSLSEANETIFRLEDWLIDRFYQPKNFSRKLSLQSLAT